MITLIRMDAAFRCLQDYDPDLDVRPLTVEWPSVDAKDRAILYTQTHMIRMMMVARIADIVRQTPNDQLALDAAVAMVEVLISTCEGRGEHPIRGHKQAMQAIRLLASVYSHLDVAIDLFFDLVERFCAQSRSRGFMQTGADVCSNAFANRMLQNYDQALLRLISKHRDPYGIWDITRPMERIKDLRHLYEFLEGPKTSMRSRFRIRNSAPALFPDSYKLLRKALKQGVAAIVSWNGKGYRWASTPKLSGSTATLNSDLSSPASVTTWGSFSTASGSLRGTTGTCSQIDWSELARSEAEMSPVMQTELPIEPKSDLRVLYEITEESEYGSAVDMGVYAMPALKYDPEILSRLQRELDHGS